VTRRTTNVYLPVRRAVERRKSRRQARKELAQAAKQREQLTPRALAEMVAASDLARSLGTGDVEKITSKVAELVDRDRYILAMVAEGHSNLEVAHQLYIPAEQVRRDVKRIVKFLREEEDAEA